MMTTSCSSRFALITLILLSTMTFINAQAGLTCSNLDTAPEGNSGLPSGVSPKLCDPGYFCNSDSQCQAFASHDPCTAPGATAGNMCTGALNNFGFGTTPTPFGADTCPATGPVASSPGVTGNEGCNAYACLEVDPAFPGVANQQVTLACTPFEFATHNPLSTCADPAELPTIQTYDTAFPSFAFCGPYSGTRGDPQFIGFRGQSYQVHGIDGAVYNLISHKSMQLNTRFGFISQGKCPKLSHASRTKTCWSHPGSYMTAIGLALRVDDHMIQVELIAGSSDSGFESMTLNGKVLTIGTNTTITSANGNVAFAITIVNSHLVTLHTPLFDFEMENSDMFINQNTITNVALNRLQTHGLLGQTWQQKTYNGGVKFIEGEVDDYVILDDQLFGTNFIFNAFNVTA